MRKGKRDKLEFQRGMLGRLSPAALHEQLHAVATDNPSGLSTLNKPEMQKLLCGSYALCAQAQATADWSCAADVVVFASLALCT